MNIKIKIFRYETFEIPDEKVEELKKGLAERWGEEYEAYDKNTIWDEYDLLNQAEHDGLIELPESEDWEVD